jgi:c-di-GMP-binding flagellar brake protein YcgR
VIGTTLRVRAHAGVYRSKLLALDGDFWRISVPLQRNHYVPLREGERITIEAPVKGGVYLFKTVVHRFDEDRNELVFEVPPLTAPRERRSEARRSRHEEVLIDDAPALLVDVSRHGAKLRVTRRIPLGDRIKLRLPEGMVVGWVIDVAPLRSGEGDLLRVRFETPLP